MPRSNQSWFPVLLYHHVGSTRPSTYPTLTVSPPEFARQVDWLRRRGFRSLSIDQVAAWATRGQPLPKRSVLITFDDGYADLAEFAFPILIAAGFTATVFLVTERLGDRNAWDAETGHDGHRVIDEEAVKSWSRRGIEFGAHTRTHPDLSKLAPQAAEAEMVGSRRDLEALLDRPVDSFAYPFGITTPIASRLAGRFFSVAFLALEEGINRNGIERSLLRRTMVQSTDRLVDIALRVRFGFSARQRVRRRLVLGRTKLRQAVGLEPL